jgi:hypothetical protein
MKKLVSASSNTEISGRVVLAFFKNVRREELEPILKKHGLDSIKPEHWYPQQLCLNILRDMVGCRAFVTDCRVAIGIKAAEVVSLPPEIDCLGAFLHSLTDEWSVPCLGFRQGANPVGNLFVKHVWGIAGVFPFTVKEKGLTPRFLAEGHVLVTNNTSYPDDNILGYLWGMARRLLGPGKPYIVRQACEPKPTRGESTIYEVIWGTNSWNTAP